MRAAAPVLARDAFDDRLKKAEEFKKGGAKTKLNVSAGFGGGFDAIYDPAADKLKIVVRAIVIFKDGLDAAGTPLPKSGLDDVVKDLAASGPKRTAFLDLFKWDPSEHAPWMTKSAASVKKAWSGKHEFHVGDPQWEWIGASVEVDVQTKAATDESERGDAHLAMTVVKVPSQIPDLATGKPKGAPRVAANAPFGTSAGNDQSMIVGSNDNEANKNFLRTEVLFENNSSDLTGDAAGAIATFAGRFKGTATEDPEARGAKITVVAHASKSGSAEHNQKLSEKRAAAVVKALKDEGMNRVESRATSESKGESEATGEEAKDRRAVIAADGGVGFNTLDHEFGHSFGLTDEYSGLGSGRAPGDALPQAPAMPKVKDANGAVIPGGTKSENNDSIMSVGDKVEAQHYGPFLQGLQQASGVSNWLVGAKQPKPTKPSGSPAPAPGVTPPPGPAPPVPA